MLRRCFVSRFTPRHLSILVPTDNHKLITVFNFSSKYVKDATYIYFMRNMLGKSWNLTVCTKTTLFLFVFLNVIFYIIIIL